MEQMTIFDYLQDADMEVTADNEAEIVRRLSEKTGLDFTLKDLRGFKYYLARVGKTDIELNFSTYYESTKHFVGVSWNYKTSGGSCPCDTLNEAYNKIKTYIERAKAEKERLKRGKSLYERK